MATNLGQSCPKCGRPLPARAADGLCRHCLAGRLLEPESELASALDTGLPRRFGDYELIEELARGGMGVIYRARQLGLNRLVALKLVARWNTAPDFLERFEIEAEASASLSHPHIVPIHEFGDHNGQPFLSMQLLQESLDRKIARGPLDLKAAVELVIKVARAVHFAHQRGIIHRDIKPSNILLDEAGEPFLADFGLAKLVERESALTVTQAMLGTPAYVSPEQALGKTSEVTTATDVYSLGAVLYELIAGQPPFKGGTTLDTVRLVIEQEPRPPSARNPKANRDLDTICLRCLEKDPQKRYASSEAMADDLERWSQWLPIQARPINGWERLGKWVRRHPAWAMVIVISAGALLAVSVVSTTAREKLAIMGEERRAQLVRLNLAAAERSAETGDVTGALHWHLQAMQLERQQDPAEAGLQRHAVGALLRGAPRLEAMFFHTRPVNLAIFSPDGQRVLTGSDDFTACIWNARTGERLTDPLPHDGQVYQASFSPDGKFLVTCADDELARVWDATTGKPMGRPLRCSVRIRRPLLTVADFRQDGRAIVTRWENSAQIWNAQTGERMGDPFEHDLPVTQATFSPDGRSVLTASIDGTAQIWDASDPAAARVVLRPGGVVEGAVFSPDGALVATFADWGGIQIWDAATGKQVGLTMSHEKNRLLYQCVFSPDGRSILSVDRDNGLRLWDARTGRAIWEKVIEVGISMAQFSPDGKRVVVAGLDMNARVLDAANGALAWPVLRHGSLVYSAFFDPAGERVVTAVENGVAQVWRWSREQASSLRVDFGRIVGNAHVDGNGRRVVMRADSGEVGVWEVQSGKLLRELEAGTVMRGTLSEDGEKLATVTHDGRIRFWPALAKDEVLEMTSENLGLTWEVAFNRDGSRLLVLGRAGAALWDPDKAREIATGIKWGDGVLFGEFSADGSRFVIGGYGGAQGIPGPHTTIQVYESAGATPVGKPIRQIERVDYVNLSGGGKWLVTGSGDSFRPPTAAWVWNMETGLMITGPLLHRDGVRLVAFSPDTRWVATAGKDAVLRVWDSFTGVPRIPPIVQRSRSSSLAFSADGRMLAAGGVDGIARVWSAKTGRPLTPPLYHAGRVLLVRILPEGKGLLTVCADGQARVWSLDPNADSIERLTDRAELLSSHRFDLEAGLVPMDRESLARLWRRLPRE